jgi:hypothetical protein
MGRIALSLLVLLVLPQAQARADEAIYLLDKTKVIGQFLHYYDGVATVELPNGTKMRLPIAKIRKVEFALPKPRSALSTPRKSFTRLRKAALRGDLETYIDSHSTYYQMVLNHQVQVATPKKFIRELKKEWGSAQLDVIGSEVKGAMAVLKVRRRQGGESQEGELRFVKENKEWKMILPL